MLLFKKVIYIYLVCLSNVNFVILNKYFFSRHKQKMLSTHLLDTYNSRSAFECSATCSMKDECWSASYNDVTGVCRLSDVQVKMIQNNWDSDVEWQTFAKIETTIGNHCTADSDCIEVNSICLDDICFCDSRTKYNKATRSCEKECDNYGNAFVMHEHYKISGYNIDKRMLSLDRCKQECIDMGNVCGSVDYNDEGECWPQTATYEQVFEAEPTAIRRTSTVTIHSRFCQDVTSIGQPCVLDSDCVEINSICLDRICFCNSTTKYNPLTRSCDKECDNYGSTFTVYEGFAITHYNHDMKNNKLLMECKQICLDMGNACGSFEYTWNECWPGTVTYQQASEAHPTAIGQYNLYSIYSRSCE